jgi:hypothetical protein
VRVFEYQLSSPQSMIEGRGNVRRFTLDNIGAIRRPVCVLRCHLQQRTGSYRGEQTPAILVVHTVAYSATTLWTSDSVDFNHGTTYSCASLLCIPFKAYLWFLRKRGHIPLELIFLYLGAFLMPFLWAFLFWLWLVWFFDLAISVKLG